MKNHQPAAIPAHRQSVVVPLDFYRAWSERVQTPIRDSLRAIGWLPERKGPSNRAIRLKLVFVSNCAIDAVADMLKFARSLLYSEQAVSRPGLEVELVEEACRNLERMLGNSFHPEISEQ